MKYQDYINELKTKRDIVSELHKKQQEEKEH